MGSHSKTYRATAAPSVGTGWEDAANIYDNSTSTYCKRSSLTTGNSAIHINGFGIDDIPSSGVIDSIDVVTQMGLDNDNGIFAVYVYTDEGPTSILSTIVANGAEVDGKQTHSYSASTIQEKIDSKGVCNGDIKQLLSTLRVRFVGGSNDSSILKMCGCYIYDNYVVVNYTIPDYKLTLKATEGGSVSGGGTYEKGTKVTIKATPDEGYKFVSWSDGNTNASRRITVNAKKTLTATFEKIETSKVYCGTKKVSVYCGTKKVSVCCGTVKIL